MRIARLEGKAMKDYEQKYGSHENLAKSVKELEKNYDKLNKFFAATHASPPERPRLPLRMPATTPDRSRRSSPEDVFEPQSRGDGGGMGAALGGIRRGLGEIFGAQP